MKRILPAAVILGAGCVAGFAADPGARPYTKAPVMDPVYNWSGFYLGGNVGYHEGRDYAVAVPGPETTLPPGFDVLTPGTTRPGGVAGGFQAGYNWRIHRNIVLGIEGDISLLDGDASRRVVLFAVNPFTTRSSSTYLATVRPRLGIAVDRALFYATGGLAVSDLKTTDSFGFFAGTRVSSTSNSTTRIGWTAGVGVEYAIASQWTAKLEYLYADFGSFETTIPPCVGLFCGARTEIPVRHRFTESIVRVGINYSFGGGGTARN